MNLTESKSLLILTELADLTKSFGLKNMIKYGTL